MKYGLIGPAYTSESPSADAETLVNWYVERMESDGARSQAVLYPRPGYFPFAQLSTPNRGALEINDLVFTVSNDTVYQLYQDQTYQSRGTIANDSKPVSMVAGTDGLLIVSAGSVYWMPLGGGVVGAVTNLQNTAGTYALEWTISTMSVVSNTRNISTITEAGSTVTVTFNASAISNDYRKLLTAGNSITIAGVTEAGYNGDFTIVSADISNPAAVVVTYTNPTTGLPSDTTGTIQWFYLQIQINPIGVGVETGDTVVVAGCTHAAFNGTYTVGSTVAVGLGGLLVNTLCPLALIADVTVAVDGSLITSKNVPIQCGYLDGYFIIWYAQSQYWIISSPFAGYSWDMGDLARISAFPDNIKSMQVDHGEVWFFGEQNSIAYSDTGGSALSEFPFTPILASRVEQGSDSTFGTVTLDNTIFWLGRDQRGALVAWRLNGYLPQRVSNHAIEYAWQNYIKTSDAESFSMQWYGHTFWFIYFPSVNKTWVYDVATNTWHVEQSYFSGYGQLYLRARNHVYAWGMHLVGDPGSAYIWYLSPFYYQDYLGAITRERQAPPVFDENEWLFFDQMQVDLESGIGNLPDFTGITQYAAPTVTGASTGGSLQKGFYTVRLVRYTTGTVVAATDDGFGLVTDSNGNLTISAPVNTTWRVFISNDGWRTSQYSDIAITTSTVVTSISGWTTGFPPNTKAPQMTFAISKNNTQSYVSHTIDCPTFGDYEARGPLLNRIGRARKCIFKISVTDPVFWPIINGYVVASK